VYDTKGGIEKVGSMIRRVNNSELVCCLRGEQWFCRLQVFLLLVKVPFRCCRCVSKIFQNGGFGEKRPCREMVILDSLYPGGFGGAETGSCRYWINSCCVCVSIVLLMVCWCGMPGQGTTVVGVRCAGCWVGLCCIGMRHNPIGSRYPCKTGILLCLMRTAVEVNSAVQP
jgi:hypothetical protein